MECLALSCWFVLSVCGVGLHNCDSINIKINFFRLVLCWWWCVIDPTWGVKKEFSVESALVFLFLRLHVSPLQDPLRNCRRAESSLTFIELSLHWFDLFSFCSHELVPGSDGKHGRVSDLESSGDVVAAVPHDVHQHVTILGSLCQAVTDVP